MTKEEWSWKVSDPDANQGLGLLYEPGTWGDVFKGAWAVAVVRALARAGRRTLRYVDPFAGAATYPLVPATTQRLGEFPALELRALLEPHLCAGRFPSTALLVQAAAAEAGVQCELEVFDADATRLATWAGRPGVRVLDGTSGDEALPSDADLVLVDPYDLFEREEQLLPRALGGSPESAVLLYLFNKAPRGATAHKRYKALRQRCEGLRGERSVLVGRVPSDAILPRAYHEMILVAPAQVCEDARPELERRTLALSRHLSDAGAFEASEA